MDSVFPIPGCEVTGSTPSLTLITSTVEAALTPLLVQSGVSHGICGCSVVIITPTRLQRLPPHVEDMPQASPAAMASVTFLYASDQQQVQRYLSNLHLMAPADRPVHLILTHLQHYTCQPAYRDPLSQAVAAGKLLALLAEAAGYSAANSRTCLTNTIADNTDNTYNTDNRSTINNNNLNTDNTGYEKRDESKRLTGDKTKSVYAASTGDHDRDDSFNTPAKRSKTMREDFQCLRNSSQGIRNRSSDEQQEGIRNCKQGRDDNDGAGSNDTPDCKQLRNGNGTGGLEVNYCESFNEEPEHVNHPFLRTEPEEGLSDTDDEVDVENYQTPIVDFSKNLYKMTIDTSLGTNPSTSYVEQQNNICNPDRIASGKTGRNSDYATRFTNPKTCYNSNINATKLSSGHLAERGSNTYQMTDLNSGNQMSRVNSNNNMHNANFNKHIVNVTCTAQMPHATSDAHEAIDNAADVSAPCDGVKSPVNACTAMSSDCRIANNIEGTYHNEGALAVPVVDNTAVPVRITREAEPSSRVPHAARAGICNPKTCTGSVLVGWMWGTSGPLMSPKPADLEYSARHLGYHVWNISTHRKTVATVAPGEGAGGRYYRVTSTSSTGVVRSIHYRTSTGSLVMDGTQNL